MNHPHYGEVAMVPIRIMESGLSSKAIAAYVALAACANNEGLAEPPIALLAKRTNMSRSSVKRGLAELVERGFVRRQRRRYESGPETTSLYWIAAAPNMTTLIPEEPRP